MLKEQFVNLNKYILDQHRLIPAARLHEFDAMLKVQNLATLTSQGSATARAGLRAGWGKKFLKWLANHLTEIKKIIKIIVNAIFDLLNLPRLGWLDELFNLIDQLWDFIMSLLADVFGLDVPTVSREISEQHIQSMNEQRTAEAFTLARLRTKSED